MCETLYRPHRELWHKKLAVLIENNQHILGREGDPSEFGIFYNGVAWFCPLPEIERTDVSQFNILPIQHNMDTGELEKVTTHLAELQEEYYVIERFLTGLLLLPAALTHIEEAFGPVLFGRVRRYFVRLHETTWNGICNETSEHAFKTYVTQNSELIDTLCRRVMMNMIARDALNT